MAEILPMRHITLNSQSISYLEKYFLNHGAETKHNYCYEARDRCFPWCYWFVKILYGFRLGFFVLIKHIC